MSTLTPLPAAGNAPAAPQSSDRTQLRKAAQGFEAIFVRQMLSAARAASLGGSDALFGGQAQETFAAMRDERFAEIAANSGAFGLARQLEGQLARMLPASVPASAAKPAGKD
ncbi:MAG: rod-binding protein [Novosphingobium sp.]